MLGYRSAFYVCDDRKHGCIKYDGHDGFDIVTMKTVAIYNNTIHKPIVMSS